MEIQGNDDSVYLENLTLLHLKQEKGESLLETLTKYSNVNGIKKLERKIYAELRFLDKVTETK